MLLLFRHRSCYHLMLANSARDAMNSCYNLCKRWNQVRRMCSAGVMAVHKPQMDCSNILSLYGDVLVLLWNTRYGDMYDWGLKKFLSLSIQLSHALCSSDYVLFKQSCSLFSKISRKWKEIQNKQSSSGWSLIQYSMWQHFWKVHSRNVDNKA